MAASGIIGIAFLIAHVAGNLLVFRGAEAMNQYSRFLHGPASELLWPIRTALLAAVVLHVVAAYQLRQSSRAARLHAYTRREPQVATLASRLMRWSGMLLLVFIIFHILHFTTGVIRPNGVFTPGDVYANVVGSFRIWWVSLFYVAAMLALGLHLYHGAWSSARTLGVAGRSPDPLHRNVAAVIAIGTWLAFTLAPVAVFTGWVG